MRTCECGVSARDRRQQAEGGGIQTAHSAVALLNPTHNAGALGGLDSSSNVDFLKSSRPMRSGKPNRWIAKALESCHEI